MSFSRSLLSRSSAPAILPLILARQEWRSACQRKRAVHLGLERVRRTLSNVRQKNSLQIQYSGACPYRKTAYTFSGHALALTLLVTWPVLSYAQEEPSKSRPSAGTPLPPVRPSHLPTTPAAPVVSPKTLTPALQQPAPQSMPLAEPSAAPLYPDHGPSLPTASRARMHQCSQEWSGMKASGAAADKTWRAFAQACLIR